MALTPKLLVFYKIGVIIWRHTYHGTRGGQRTALWGWFFPSTIVWSLGTLHKLLDFEGKR